MEKTPAMKQLDFYTQQEINHTETHKTLTEALSACIHPDDLQWQAQAKVNKQHACVNYLQGLVNDALLYVRSQKRYWCDQVAAEGAHE